MVHFREVQQFPWWARLIPGGVVVLFGFGVIQQVILGVQFGSKPSSNAGLLFALAASAAFFLWFASLRLELPK